MGFKKREKNQFCQCLKGFSSCIPFNLWRTVLRVSRSVKTLKMKYYKNFRRMRINVGEECFCEGRREKERERERRSDFYWVNWWMKIVLIHTPKFLVNLRRRHCLTWALIIKSKLTLMRNCPDKWRFIACKYYSEYGALFTDITKR